MIVDMCLDASTAVKHTDEVKSSGFNNLVSRPLPSDEDQSNLEITELDSYIDTDVQMEASGISSSILVLSLVFVFIRILVYL